MRQETQRLVGILWLEGMHRVILSFFPPTHPFFPSSCSLLSISPSTALPRLLGRSLGRQCSQDGWGDGGWTNRKHLSPIMTEENHIIWFAWHFSWGRLICPSHSSIHLVMTRGHLSHSRQRVRRKISGRTGCVSTLSCFKCTQAQSHATSAIQGYEQCN